MIPERKQLRILAMHHAGKHSQRQIAEIVGVANATVGNVIHRGTVVRGKGSLARRPSFGYLEVEVYRCGGCGVLVKLRPCAICRARKGNSQ